MIRVANLIILAGDLFIACQQHVVQKKIMNTSKIINAVSAGDKAIQYVRYAHFKKSFCLQAKKYFFNFFVCIFCFTLVIYHTRVFLIITKNVNLWSDIYSTIFRKLTL